MSSQTNIDYVNLEVLTHVDRTSTYTVVTVHSRGYTGIGVAKRNPSDPYDYRIGQRLALARALREAADDMEEE